LLNLELPRSEEGKRDPIFLDHWDFVQLWSENSRYRKNDSESAQKLIEAIGDRLEIVHALDCASLSISVAMWLYLSEYEDWRFLLASRRLDAAKGSSPYRLVRDALAASGITLERTPTLLILEMYDPFIRALRRMFAKTKNVEGMRLGGQLIGDRFVEDALVYRIR
jgi:hypothetical protein